MIENKDKKILGELLKNGRISFSDLGRKCHMTRQSVFSRIKSLEHKGIIKNFTVNLNEKRLGLNLKAYILVESGPFKESKNNPINSLKSLPQISEIHHLFGRYSFLVEVLVKDIDELKGIVKKIREIEYVRRTETMIVYNTEKYMPQHPIEGALN
jgi:Lrp/AsnC family leucine-responsive transcriptional regulator